MWLRFADRGKFAGGESDRKVMERSTTAREESHQEMNQEKMTSLEYNGSLV
jgi:hypothetical protein